MRQIFILFAIIIAFLFVYSQIAVDIYVNYQSESLCNWLNHSVDAKPRVGPLAYKRLNYLKSKYANNFYCEVEESPHSYGYSDEKAVVIYHKGRSILGLVYGFSYGGVKNFFRPRYYQLWTPKDSGEPGEEIINAANKTN